MNKNTPTTLNRRNFLNLIEYQKASKLMVKERLKTSSDIRNRVIRLRLFTPLLLKQEN